MNDSNSSSQQPVDSGKETLLFDAPPPEAFYRRRARKSLQNCSGGHKQGRAYLQSSEIVPKAVHAYIANLLGPFNLHTRRLFGHIFVCSRLWHYDEGWVPISSRLLRGELRQAKPKELVLAELLEMEPEDRFYHSSREYRITDHVLYSMLRITHENLWDRRVDLFSGKPTSKRERTRLNDEHNNPHPELIRDAMKVISKGYFNDLEIQRHLSLLLEDVEQARSRFHSLQSTSGDRTEAQNAKREYRKALSRYSNDLRCYESILNQKPTSIGNGVSVYPVPLKPQPFGRVSHIGGGLQSCSREMKVRAYTRVADVHNYDVKSSQAYILLDFLETAGLEGSWLRTYLDTKDAKAVYARRVGLTVDTWKRCLYALFMGGRLSTHPAYSRRSDIIKAIRAEVGPENLADAFRRFRKEVLPLYKVLKEWHMFLEEEWVPTHGYRVRGDLYIRNDTGSVLNIENYKELPRWQRQAKLAAFLLQGKEAAFIHALTILAPTHGFRVIANEHDGLVTIGAIPAAAIEQVRQIRSMHYVEIIEKTFV